MIDDPLSDVVFAGCTLAEAQRRAAEMFRRRPSIDAAVDARRLLMHATGCDAIDLVKRQERSLSKEEAARFACSVTRRLVGEPVSRIAGRRGFYGREFLITPETLDPRPESETLIEVALETVADEFPRGEGLNILDIGTGTGCLLLTLLAELPKAVGTGVDVSEGALTVARENGRLLKLEERVHWVQGRGFAGLRSNFGLIISNPPYVATATISQLEDEVKHFDPLVALNGGQDGLDVYREIAGDLQEHRNRARVFFEVGDDQAADVEALLRAAIPSNRISDIAVKRDMAGKQRCVAMLLQN